MSLGGRTASQTMGYVEFNVFTLAVVVLLLILVITKWFMSTLKIGDITGRWVFITGCDTGFGNLLAKRLDSAGVRVIASCLTMKGKDQLQLEASSRLTAILLDVTKKESIEAAYLFVHDKVRRDGLWCVVNNAGVMPSFAPWEWTGMEESVYQVNLFGTIAVTQAFLPLLRQSRGRLVNVCSIMSMCAFPGVTNYAVSKAGVKMFTTCLRRELMNSGVTIHSIEPGGFKTNITDSSKLIGSMHESYRQVSLDLQEYYGGNIATYLLDGLKIIDKFLCQKQHTVVDCMAHAVLAKYPSIRYTVGPDTKHFFLLMQLLPERLVDYIVGWPSPYGATCKDFEERAENQNGVWS